jgi:hypothetical protein
VAYDYLLRGRDLLLAFDDTHNPAAREMFEKVIALDDSVANAYTCLAILRLRALGQSIGQGR